MDRVDPQPELSVALGKVDVGSTSGSHAGLMRQACFLLDTATVREHSGTALLLSHWDLIRSRAARCGLSRLISPRERANDSR